MSKSTEIDRRPIIQAVDAAFRDLDRLKNLERLKSYVARESEVHHDIERVVLKRAEASIDQAFDICRESLEGAIKLLAQVCPVPDEEILAIPPSEED